MSKEDLIKYILNINEYSKNNDTLNINKENIDEIMTRDLRKKNQKFQIIKNNKINMQKNQKTIFNKKYLKTKPKNTFKNRK